MIFSSHTVADLCIPVHIRVFVLRGCPRCYKYEMCRSSGLCDRERSMPWLKGKKGRGLKSLEVPGDLVGPSQYTPKP